MLSLLTVAVLLLAAPAGATQVQADQVPCPVGGAPAQIFRLVAKNALGGWDTDGATYSSQGQYRTYEVSTCPNYPLSLYGRDMETGLTEEELALVRPLLSQLEVEFSDPSRLEVWDRYVMAARCYQALQRDAWYVARVYLKGAWTLRDAAVGELNGLHGPLVVRRLLLAGDAELTKPELTDAQRKVLLFNMARAAHRGGHNALSARYMSAIRDIGGLDADEERVLASLERARAQEPVLMELAMTQLALVLEGKQGAEAKARARYLMADLLRRTDRTEVAATTFEAVAADRKAPEVLRELSRYLAAELRGERPWETVEGNPFATPWTP